MGDDSQIFTGITIFNNQSFNSLPSYSPAQQHIIDTTPNPDIIADPDVATLDQDPTAPNSDQHGSNSYVVVYRRDAADGSFSDIRAILQSNFSGYVKEFTIKSSATGELSKPQVTHLNGGGFMVAWIDEYAPDQREVRLQRFDGDGNAIGNEITFNNPVGRYIWDFDLETMANGRVLLTVSDGTANRGIAYAIYNVNGNHITGTDAGETLTANTGDSILEGLGGNDILLGLDGDDWMSGGTGTDSFDGGGGNDTVDFTYSNSDWIVNLLTGTAVAGSTTETLVDIENVNTGGGDDIIIGDNGVNILKGNGGDDTITGGQNADDIDGGSGNDTADYENEWTGLALAPFGTRTYDLQADQMTWANVTAPGAGGYTERMAGIENVIGSDFDETFIADLAANTFTGNGGNDAFKAHNAAIYLSALQDIYAGMDGIDAADFGAITLASGHTSASRSFTISLTGNASLAFGSAVEDGGGTLATFLDIETVRGTNYNDTITGNSVCNQLNGGAGDDVISGEGGADDLRGGEGNDILIGGSGIDSFDGGEGTDTVDYSATAGSARYDLALQKFTGSFAETWVSIENVIAGSGNDTVIGSQSGNEIHGNNGDDLLDGRGGTDTMIGGTGNDTYIVDRSADVIVEDVGGGILDKVLSRVSYTLAAGVAVEILEARAATGTTSINLTGNLLSQWITGNNGRNVLNAGGKEGAIDTLRGLGGNDTYRVFNAGDVVEEAVGNGVADRVIAQVSYVLAANAEVEFLSTNSNAGRNNFNLTGNDFAQTITGNAGNNILLGLDGDDTIIGLAGADTIDGGDAEDTLSYAGSAAGVTVTMSLNAYAGGDADGDVVTNIEHLTGSSHADTIVGNGFDNRIDGGDGADEIRGANGQDDLTGGNGDDRFTYLSTFQSAPGTADRILDFSQTPGNRDLINLSVIDAQTSNADSADVFTFIGLSAFSAEGQIRAVQSGLDTIVQVNTTGSGTSEMEIILIGVTATNITAADFIL